MKLRGTNKTNQNTTTLIRTGAGRVTGTFHLQRPQRHAIDVQLAGSGSNGGRVYGPAEAARAEFDQVADLDVDNSNPDGNLLASETEAGLESIDGSFTSNTNRRPLQIIRLFAPEAVRNGQENVTIGNIIGPDQRPLLCCSSLSPESLIDF